MASPVLAAQSSARVLVVDDSAFMRHSIERILNRTAGLVVVGTANDGVDAVKRALELRPDVITMDVEMPRMDGVAAVTEIMQTVPTPIVMLSTRTTAGAETTIRALEAGAVDCVAKPSGLSHELANVAQELGAAVLRARQVIARRRLTSALPAAPAKAISGTSDVPAGHLVVIGSSTGGPPALTEVVPHLPADLNAAVVIVQHMPPGFTAALARRLDSLSPLHVVEATEGASLSAGKVLIAPGDYHLVVTPQRKIHLDQGPSLHGVRPAVDITLDSAASVYGRRLTVAILTGMGKDGADGAARCEREGAHIVVQDEATCVVYGMPRVAKERTQHASQLPLDRIAEAVVKSVAPRGLSR
ncbi:MAG: chemotaxis response regulator protein-glutamate methylesterase [Chloroflexi bacterium]|nr:chemotaxis response regulator protein-glutamate methylesterase [Chloroflexota bacterium]